jgi:DNA-binding transcriptional LysR family regulator
MRLNRLDLNQMICLDALLAERNVSRAAKRVFISQPAMSLALRRLRDHFEDELLVPAGRTYQLTPFAQDLQAPVRNVVLQLRGISGWRPKFDPAHAERKITIEASDYVCAVLMQRVFEHVYAEAPKLRFDLRILSAQFHENLDSGEVDILVIPEPLCSDRHPHAPLFTDTFSCVLWRGNRRVGSRLTLSQYLEMGHVVPDWDSGRMPALDQQVMSRKGLKRRNEMTAPSFSIAAQSVVGTDRVATVQTRLARQIAAHWPVKVLPCPAGLPTLVEAVQWHRHQESDPAIMWFLKKIQAVAGELEASGGTSGPSRGPKIRRARASR